MRKHLWGALVVCFYAFITAALVVLLLPFTAPVPADEEPELLPPTPPAEVVPIPPPLDPDVDLLEQLCDRDRYERAGQRVPPFVVLDCPR